MTRIFLTPQAEDDAVIEAVVPFLRDAFPLASRALDPASLPDGFWRNAAELGWGIAALDEEAGGAGFDLAQDMLMNREYGRFVAPLSLLSTALGIRVLARAGEVPAAVLEGQERIGFAAFVAGGALGPSPSGAVHLIDADAEHFLIVGAEGAAVVGRDAISDVTPVESLDPTLTLARGTLSGTAAWLSSADEPIALRLQLLLAAQMTGLGLAASDMAVDYAKVREQFGKPIGTFQAVAHLCVDASVRVRAADAQVAVAAVALRDGWSDAAVQVAAAAQVADTAAFLAGTNNIQVHGGMGYSAESGAHLFLKRTILLRHLMPLGRQADEILLAGAA